MSKTRSIQPDEPRIHDTRRDCLVTEFTDQRFLLGIGPVSSRRHALDVRPVVSCTNAATADDARLLPASPAAIPQETARRARRSPATASAPGHRCRATAAPKRKCVEEVRDACDFVSYIVRHGGICRGRSATPPKIRQVTADNTRSQPLRHLRDHKPVPKSDALIW
jgi:hypothetical protein